MDRNPFVSIIIPAYNMRDYITETLESVSRQTFGDWEAIVVDDGSTDSTCERVRHFLCDPRFRLIQQENKGVAGAINSGLRCASGDWVALLGADDIWLPEKLEKQVSLVRAQMDTALVFSNGIEFDERGDTGAFYREPRKMPVGDIILRLLERNCLWASSVMVRRSDLLEVGMFDEDIAIGEDYLVWVRILARGGHAAGVWEPLVRYRKRGGSACSNKVHAFRDVEKVHTRFLDLDLTPEQRATVHTALLRDRAGQCLALARARLDAGEGSVATLLANAWMHMPAAPRPLAWILLLALPGGRKLLARKLSRRW